MSRIAEVANFVGPSSGGRGLGNWARAHEVPSLVVSHERLDRLLEHWLHPLPTSWLADRSNRRLAAMFDAVVCTTGWAGVEFSRLDVPNLRFVPLGVDATAFSPDAADTGMRRRLCPDGGVLLVMATRLSREKQPRIGVAAAAELAHRCTVLTLVVAGDGPLRSRLQREAPDVRFLGHVPNPGHLAAVLAAADVVFAPGPVETFGLAALEALACGTPVFVNERSALPNVF